MPTNPNNPDPAIDLLGLHGQLVEATARAEMGSPYSQETRRIWVEVSHIEEMLAECRTVSPSDQVVSQCAAIRASLKAGDQARARELTLRWHLELSPRTFEVLEVNIWGSERIPGFPYNEGLPVARDEEYVIILGDGRRLAATLDLSTQYRTEGIQWATSEGIFPQFSVAAWFAGRLPL
ncbi:TPA: hypothetical protein DEP96_03750 [Candidatus Uhrbacteria bacterium]|nr:hypothetical protein [Candidatus Uhrbacteria bacterium]